jgi:hypothetical protein
MDKKVTIELTDYEAKQFVVFQKHRELFEMLEHAGFFELKNGSLELHKDTFGKVMVMDKHEHLRV